MGDEVAPDDPTQLAAVSEPETQSAQAWALDYDDAVAVQPRMFSLGQLVTGVAVVLSLTVVVGVAVMLGYRLRDDQGAGPSAPTTSPMVQASAPPPLPVPKTVVAPAPPPSTVTVHAPPPPVPQAPRQVGFQKFTTYISWTGAPCIDVRFPNLASMNAQSTCNPGGTQTVFHTARSGELIGADPVIGQATAMACKVVADATQTVVYADSGTAGDGHDINCIVTAP